MFPFDVILFDIGGVLLTNGWDRHERAETIQFFELDAETFEARHQEAYGAWERGAIPLYDYLTATVFYEPRSFSTSEFYAFMLAHSQLLPNGALGILSELSASKQCMIGALNNEARETNEYRLKQFGLRRHFAVTLSSCYLGLRKPDAAIYARALDILGRPAERILFIDDRQENVAAAQDAGLVALQFEGAEALRRDLTNLHVL